MDNHHHQLFFGAPKIDHDVKWANELDVFHCKPSINWRSPMYRNPHIDHAVDQQIADPHEGLSPPGPRSSDTKFPWRYGVLTEYITMLKAILTLFLRCRLLFACNLYYTRCITLIVCVCIYIYIYLYTYDFFIIYIYICNTYGHVPKIVDRSFAPVVENWCGPSGFSPPLWGGTQLNSPILQGSASKPARFAQVFFPHPCSKLFFVFLFACYFNMKKSQDGTLSSLHLRMSYLISVLLNNLTIFFRLQLNFANLYVILSSARSPLAMR